MEAWSKALRWFVGSREVEVGSTRCNGPEDVDGVDVQDGQFLAGAAGGEKEEQ